MSSGNPGTTIAGGNAGAPIITPYMGRQVVQIDIPDLFLPQGIYWVQAAAFSGAISGTSGTNAIGTTPNLASIRNWPLFGQFYQPFSDTILSTGVTLVIPSPSAAAVLGLGGLMISRRRRAR
jgi:hypothetical protein